MTKPILGYWDIRGLAQPVRLLITYLNIDFEDVRYTEPDAWFSKKFEMGFDFPNLPYYIEGDLKLTQMFAILHHLARKHNLHGATERELLDIALIEEVIRETAMVLSYVAYNENWETLKSDCIKKLEPMVKQIADFMKGRKFVVGDRLTFVDFLAYERLVKFQVLIPELMAPHAGLKEYIDRIEALPAIAAYKAKQEPKLFNGPTAKWNATY